MYLLLQYPKNVLFHFEKKIATGRVDLDVIIGRGAYSLDPAGTVRLIQSVG